MASDEMARDMLLAFCSVVPRSARRGMREVSGSRAVSLDLLMAKERQFASWVVCHGYDVVDV